MGFIEPFHVKISKEDGNELVVLIPTPFEVFCERLHALWAENVSQTVEFPFLHAQLDVNNGNKVIYTVNASWRISPESCDRLLFAERMSLEEFNSHVSVLNIERGNFN